MDKYGVLNKYYGYSNFRDGQEEIIDAILIGRDALAIMPTGGGKSLCYQIPAMLMPGITVVVSPLISLMKDQVMALKNVGIPAAYINSTLTYEQHIKVYNNLKNGVYKIVYVAPERLDTEGFADLASELDISLIAVDEAHCISQWGQDFRPSYLKIVDFMLHLRKRPVIAAFTATATQTVRDDISNILKLSNPINITTGFDRPNLNFEVITPKNKLKEIHRILLEHQGKSGIIYCATRNNVEKVCDELQLLGLSVTRYHAGLKDSERKQNQEDFIYDKRQIMVATNAFGMGINKSNVSFVIHYNMPLSLEAYYQEAGRAGRDGEPADCILLFALGDVATATRLLQMPGSNDELTEAQREELSIRDLSRLNKMIDYCKTTKCLRGEILEYFGQAHAQRCENCGNCRTQFKWRDITTEAQMVLSCVKRLYTKLGYYTGKGTVVNTLHGSKSSRLLDLGIDEIKTYGIMSSVPTMQIRELIDYLEDNEYLYTDTLYKTIRLTDKAKEILFDNKHIEMPYKDMPKNKKVRPNTFSVEQYLKTDENLYEVLRQLRYETSQRENIPAYIVFSNAALKDMSSKKPTTYEEFLNVSGVGEVKAERYGEEFIKAVKTYLSSVL